MVFKELARVEGVRANMGIPGACRMAACLCRTKELMCVPLDVGGRRSAARGGSRCLPLAWRLSGCRPLWVHPSGFHHAHRRRLARSPPARLRRAGPLRLPRRPADDYRSTTLSIANQPCTIASLATNRPPRSWPTAHARSTGRPGVSELRFGLPRPRRLQCRDAARLQRVHRFDPVVAHQRSGCRRRAARSAHRLLPRKRTASEACAPRSPNSALPPGKCRTGH